MLTIVNLGSEEKILAAIESAASIILKVDCNVCGLDTEKTVENSLTPEEVIAIRRGDKINRTGPVILQLCVKGNIIKASDYKYVKTVKLESKEDYSCFIFPLLKVRLEQENAIYPKPLKKLLASPSIAKVGLNIKGDIRTMEESYGFSINGGLDLNDLAVSFGIKDSSLESLATFFQIRGKLTESAHEGNYNGNLSEAQILYSGYDAYLSLRVYEAFFSSQRAIKVSSNQQMLNITFLPELEYKDMLRGMLMDSTFPYTKNYIDEERLQQFYYNSYKKWRQTKEKLEIDGLVAKFIERALAEKVLLEPSPKTYLINPENQIMRFKSAIEEFMLNNISPTQGSPKEVILNKLRVQLESFRLPFDYNKAELLDRNLKTLITNKVIKVVAGGTKYAIVKQS